MSNMNVAVKKRNVNFNSQIDTNEIDEQGAERRPLIPSPSNFDYNAVYSNIC